MPHFVDMTPERRNRLTTVLSKRQPDLTVVLENVFDPHNVSAVMRTCDAVGVQEVHILNTKIPRHVKWGFKSSSSAAKWMTMHQYDNAAECFADLRRKYSKIMTTHLSSDAVGLYEMNMTESIALVFGNEHSGVSEEIRALADGNFLIPQVGIIQSLNISAKNGGRTLHKSQHGACHETTIAARLEFDGRVNVCSYEKFCSNEKDKTGSTVIT
jgi:tRNA (guanosine-2'-O-)-methyltransferase